MAVVVDVIMVPQGQEYQAVRRGLSQSSKHNHVNSGPLVVPVPVGAQPLRHYLKSWQFPRSRDPKTVLLMGLCGSLVPKYQVGEGVIYNRCLDGSGNWLDCDRTLTQGLYQILGFPVVDAFTSELLIFKAHQKKALASQYVTEVVDMEGYAALDSLNPQGIAVGMIRVVSDDCFHDLPDLSVAFSPEGSLKPLPLAIGMARQPLAASRLIRGSLKGLSRLEKLSRQLADSI